MHKIFTFPFLPYINLQKLKKYLQGDQTYRDAIDPLEILEKMIYKGINQYWPTSDIIPSQSFIVTLLSTLYSYHSVHICFLVYHNWFGLASSLQIISFLTQWIKLPLCRNHDLFICISLKVPGALSGIWLLSIWAQINPFVKHVRIISNPN